MNDKKLYFEIENINLIKILFDTLNKSTENARFYFSKNNIMEIICTNSNRTFFVKGIFGSKLIKNFSCDTNNYEFIININDLINIIKSFDKNDNIILFYINKEDLNSLIIEFRFNNNKLEKKEL